MPSYCKPPSLISLKRHKGPHLSILSSMFSLSLLTRSRHLPISGCEYNLQLPWFRCKLIKRILFNAAAVLSWRKVDIVFGYKQRCDNPQLQIGQIFANTVVTSCNDSHPSVDPALQDMERYSRGRKVQTKRKRCECSPLPDHFRPGVPALWDEVAGLLEAGFDWQLQVSNRADKT